MDLAHRCGRSRDNGQAHRVTITRSHDTRPVTRLASLPITALREMSALGHERTFHTLIRHVRFSAGTRPGDAIG